MLGDAALTVRLGGIYALQRLAEDYPSDYHVPIMRLFCAFIRNPTGNENDPTPAFIPIEDDQIVPSPREDVQAVVSAIGSRSKQGKAIEKYYGYTLDLRNAVLAFMELNGADLNGANLREAILYRADLTEAKLSNASLFRAKLDGAVLCQARCDKTDFYAAQLGHITAASANFAGADLFGANLLRANLRSATLSGAKMGATNLLYADFAGSEISGTIFGMKSVPADSFPSPYEGPFAHISNEQLHQTVWAPNNPPQIDDCYIT